MTSEYVLSLLGFYVWIWIWDRLWFCFDCFGPQKRPKANPKGGPTMYQGFSLALLVTRLPSFAKDASESARGARAVDHCSRAVSQLASIMDVGSRALPPTQALSPTAPRSLQLRSLPTPLCRAWCAARQSPRKCSFRICAGCQECLDGPAPPLPPPPSSSKICDSPVQTETAHQYCGSGALSTGFVAGGEEGCRGLCTATPLCRFFSSWEGGWQRHADANEQPPPPLSHFPTSPPLLSLALTLARAHQVCAHVELRCAAECQKRS